MVSAGEHPELTQCHLASKVELVGSMLLALTVAIKTGYTTLLKSLMLHIHIGTTTPKFSPVKLEYNHNISTHLAAFDD